MKALWWVLLTLCFNQSYASGFDVIGNVYEIVERDALEWISVRLREMEKTGELAKQHEALKQQAQASIERPKKVAGLQKTTKPRTFEHDLTVTVPYDITDSEGRILHLAQTKINPLNFVFSKKSLLFFDGEDKEQVTWALNEKINRKELAKLVLVNGPIAELSCAKGIRLYFDQAGRLVKNFGIKQIPAIVEQQGDKLKVSEIKI